MPTSAKFKSRAIFLILFDLKSNLIAIWKSYRKGQLVEGWETLFKILRLEQKRLSVHEGNG